MGILQRVTLVSGKVSYGSDFAWAFDQRARALMRRRRKPRNSLNGSGTQEATHTLLWIDAGYSTRLGEHFLSLQARHRNHDLSCSSFCPTRTSHPTWLLLGT